MASALAGVDRLAVVSGTELLGPAVISGGDAIAGGPGGELEEPASSEVAALAAAEAAVPMLEVAGEP